MNTPTTAHIDQTLAYIQEARANRLAYYRKAFTNALTTMTERGATTHKSRCNICGSKQSKGVQKFWFQTPRMYRGVQCGWESFEIHPCSDCLNELVSIQSQPEAAEIVAV